MMANEPRRIAPHVTTAPGQDSAGWTATLPEDLLQAVAQRLGVFCAVAAVTWVVAAILSNVLSTPSTVTPFPWPGNLVTGLVVAVNLAAYGWIKLRVKQCNCALTLDLGLGLLIVNAAAIALLNSWVPYPVVVDTRFVSWTMVLILMYAMTAPSTPVKTFAAAMVAASMDPIAVGIAHLRGLHVPTILEGTSIFIGNYIAAVLAVVPPIVLHRLARQIGQARAMGSYELVELLGRGGMGEVWRAEHRLLARPAAIKLVRRETIGAPDNPEGQLLLRRFEREAQATAVLTSPHTINLFDFGFTQDGSFYYVMELLVGRDLESLVRDFGPLPASRTVYLLRQICHSLAEAHARGLVHRDIKPANIYNCRMGLDYDFVKVLDFGLVKFAQRGGQNVLMTADRVTSGTPAYMAPEVILGTSDVDTRADVYSLGCVAYWLLTGQLVFDAESSMKMLMHHVQTPPLAPSRRTELPIPRELDDLVMACLEKDPDRRPQKAEDLLKLAMGCDACVQWNQPTARKWWEQHLPQLTQPLVLAVPTVPDPIDPATPTAVMSHAPTV
jgi:eukaryotic-like serine/threonine-protein kinase